MDVRMPDGAVIQNVPEGITQEELIGKLQNAGHDVGPMIRAIAGQRALEGMTGPEKFAAGISKAGKDLLTGTQQRIAELGGVVSPDLAAKADQLRQDVAETRQRDAALAATPQAKAGEAVGTGAILAPTALIPGANTYTGAAIIGGLAGAAQPTTSNRETLLNTGIGTGMGLLGQKVGNMIGGSTPQTQQQIIGANARAKGYVIPPVDTNPTVINKLLNGWAGKIQTQQEASAANQGVTNNLVKKTLGVPEDVTLTPDVLNGIRSQAGDAYNAVKSLPGPIRADQPYTQELMRLGAQSNVGRRFPSLANGEVDTTLADFMRGNFSPSDLVDAVKQLRFNGNANAAVQDPAKKALGNVQLGISSALEDLVNRSLAGTPQADLIPQLQAARRLIAQTYGVGKAANPVTGSVNALALARDLQSGKPLSGGLRTAAEFAAAFPKAAQPVERMGSLPGISPLDVATGVISMGNGAPTGGVLGAILGRPLVRAGILSRAYQQLMGTPGGLLRGALPGANAALSQPQIEALAQQIARTLPQASIASTPLFLNAPQ